MMWLCIYTSERVNVKVKAKKREREKEDEENWPLDAKRRRQFQKHESNLCVYMCVLQMLQVVK